MTKVTLQLVPVLSLKSPIKKKITSDNNVYLSVCCVCVFVCVIFYCWLSQQQMSVITHAVQ